MVEEPQKTCRPCGEVKPRTEFNKETARKDGLQGQCRVCQSKCSTAYYAENAASLVARRAAYYAEFPERCQAATKAWQQANATKVNAGNTQWKKKNPSKVNAANARRAAGKLQATPSWANDFFIAEAYELAKLRTEATGYKWHVDHIVPLRSKLVCGLHVENNLQVIPGAANLVKGNRYWPDMPNPRSNDDLSSTGATPMA